jgi:hypothetical protein
MDIHSREDQIFIQYHQEHFYNTLYSVRGGGSTKQIHSSVSRVNFGKFTTELRKKLTVKLDRLSVCHDRIDPTNLSIWTEPITGRRHRLIVTLVPHRSLTSPTLHLPVHLLVLSSIPSSSDQAVKGVRRRLAHTAGVHILCRLQRRH